MAGLTADDAVAVALAARDFATVIESVRALVQERRGDALRDPVVRHWVARRYRWLFVRAIEGDPVALDVARRVRGVRLSSLLVDRRRIFERFFVGTDPREADDDQPDPVPLAPTTTTLVFCPGLLTGLLPVLAFQSDLPTVSRMLQVPVRIVDSHPARSSRGNAEDLLDVLDRGRGLAADATAVPGPHPVGDVVFLGYSKGVPDVLELLVERADMAARCRAVVSIAGVVGGSFHADNVLRRIDVQDRRRLRWDPAAAELMLRITPAIRLDRLPRRLEQYDLLGALRSLSTAERAAFLGAHGATLAATGIPMFSIAAATRLLEVPYFQASSFLALARSDHLNDTQLTVDQARFPLPTAAHLATHHAHHWDLVYPPFPRATRLSSPHLDHAFPSRCLLLAMARLLGELGLLTPSPG